MFLWLKKIYLTILCGKCAMQVVDLLSMVSPGGADSQDSLIFKEHTLSGHTSFHLWSVFCSQWLDGPGINWSLKIMLAVG